MSLNVILCVLFHIIMIYLCFRFYVLQEINNGYEVFLAFIVKILLVELWIFLIAGFISVNVLLELIIFTQPLRSGRIWHKVNF